MGAALIVYMTLPQRAPGRTSWRCQVVRGDERELLQHRTKPQLLEAAERRQRALGARINNKELSATGAIAVFIGAKMRQEAWAAETLERMRDDLLYFVATLSGGPQRLVRTFGRDDVRRYLRTMERDGTALGSQRSRFAAVHGWLHYLHCEEAIAENPAALIHAIQKPWTGKRAQRRMGRGKPQLQGGAQARHYLEAALSYSDPADRVAASLPLLCGLRSGEVRHLRVADLDWDLNVLWIRGDHAVGAGDWDVKTSKSVRTVPIPEELADDLRELAAGFAGGDPLFRSHRSVSGCFEAAWLRRLVQRTCVAAKLPVVAPHGLRGTFVSICAALGRLEVPKIAELVGHADRGTTVRRAYLGTAERQPGLRLVVGER